MSLLPPNATAAERALEAAITIDALPVPLRDLWRPDTCPAEFLPWIAWGLSIDLWDPAWTEAEKRSAVAQAIEDQRTKGTPAALDKVIQRFDPMIAVVEWFEDKDVMEPGTFRLELPLAADSDVVYDEALVTALLRDIAAVKPLRAHILAVHRLRAEIAAFLIGSVTLAGFVRLEPGLDLAVPLDPVWATYLLTEDGEPIRSEGGPFLEVS